MIYEMINDRDGSQSETRPSSSQRDQAIPKYTHTTTISQLSTCPRSRPSRLDPSRWLPTYDASTWPLHSTFVSSIASTSLAIKRRFSPSSAPSFSFSSLVKPGSASTFLLFTVVFHHADLLPSVAIYLLWDDTKVSLERTIVLVGPSGAGKTSIFSQVRCSLFRPTAPVTEP